MKNITTNEMRILLTLFKDLAGNYNANNISKVIGITSMGALKILKNMEKENILISKKLGKANFYKPNLKNPYTKSYIKFSLQREAEQSQPAIKRWVNELRSFNESATAGILFGSTLQKPSSAKDIDLLLIFEKNQARKIEKLIQEKNKINVKKIHTIKQTKQDLKENINRKDKVLLSILKRGVILFGYEELIEVIENVPY